MNKKFLTKLLMGALFIASVSVFTSCKDYDDDINNLDGRVTALENSLEKQVAQLSAVQAECAANCAKTAAEVEAAKKVLDTKADKAAVDAAIEAAIKGAEATAKELDAQLLADAKAYADKVAADAAAQAQAAAVAEAKKLAEDLQAQLNSKVGTEDFNKAISELNQKIEAVNVEGLNKLIEEFDPLKSAVDANKVAIEQINNQITALNAFKEEIEKDFPGVKADVATALEKLAAQEQALKDQKDELEKAIKAAKDEFASQIEELNKKIDNSQTVAALASRVSDIESQILVINGSITSLTNSTTENANAIAEIKDAMTKAEAAIGELGDAVKKIDNLSLFLEKFVTSIYLKPDFFYGGIEAIELPALYDNQYTVTNGLVVVRENGQVTKIETWAERADLAKVDVCKGGTAWYHINPWNANLDGKIKFISNIATSRAGENDADITLITPVDENLTNDNWSKVYPGLVGVDFVGKFEDINALLKAGKLPQVALNYQQTTDEKEINVSSDWALVAPTQYMDLLIADHTGKFLATPHTGFNFGQATETEIESLGKITFAENGTEESRVDATTGHFTRLLENLTADSIPGTYQLRYDSIFNLNDLVETHFTYSYRDSYGVQVTTADQKMTDEVFEKFGLHYEFALVTYNSGNNNTDESAHMEIAQQEDGTYMAQFVQVNEDGSRMDAKADADYGFKFEQAKRASVGRMPVVRVLIKDETGKVVAYSYIKFEITEEFPEDPTIVKQEDFTFNDPFYVDCDEEGYANALTWSQVENRILINALDNDYSKATFEANWTLVGYDNKIIDVLNGEDGEATQFSEPNVEKALTENYGKVQLVEDPKGQHTQVIQWAFTHADIEKMFYVYDEQGNVVGLKNVDNNGESTNDITVYVLLDGPRKVWLKLFIPKGTFKFAKGSIDENKITAMWKALNNRNEGKKEVYANTVVPNTKSDNVLDFVLDLLDTFQGYTVIANVDGDVAKNFPQFAEGAVPTFTFTTPNAAEPIHNAEFTADANGKWTVPGNSGAEYTLKLADDALSIVVDAIKNAPEGAEAGDTIVKLVNIEADEDGDDPHAVEYQQNISAYDILNYAGHEEVASKQTFTAYLKISVAACYPMIINDGSDYFNVKFLRPVDVKKTKTAVMEDAEDGGSYANIMDLVELKDWREVSFNEAIAITDKDGSEADVTYVTYDTPHYINYYDVKIAADVDNARWDAMEKEDDRVILENVADIEKLTVLKEDAPKAIFTFTDAPITYDTQARKYVGGELYYSNNNMNIKLCHIYVPLTIEYAWSKGLPIYCGYGVVTVKKTQGQTGAKKF